MRVEVAQPHRAVALRQQVQPGVAQRVARLVHQQLEVLQLRVRRVRAHVPAQKTQRRRVHLEHHARRALAALRDAVQRRLRIGRDVERQRAAVVEPDP